MIYDSIYSNVNGKEPITNGAFQTTAVDQYNHRPKYEKLAFNLRNTIQFRWHNLDPTTNEKYESYEKYLNTVFSSKKRIKIKGERKKVQQEG